MLQFSESFEPDVLTCLFNNEGLFACVEATAGNPFNKVICRDIFNKVSEYRALHHVMPTSTELQQSLESYLFLTKEGMIHAPDYLAVITKMFLNDPNSSFTIKEVVSKIQRNLVARYFEEYNIKGMDPKTAMQISDLRQKLESIESIDTEAIVEVEEVSYTDDYKKRKDMYTSEDSVGKVPTPWPELNKHIRGGPGLGDECIVIGPTGRGKSTILSAITAGAIKQGVGVLYFNLETSVVDTCEMLDAHFIEKSRFDIRTEYTDVYDSLIEEKMLSIKDSIKDYTGKEICKIVAYPPNTITLGNIEEIIKKNKEKIHNFKMVVIDWGDCIKPTRQYSERRHEYADVFHGIKSLARKYHIVIWAATMGNKDSLNKKVVTLSDISESYAKAFMARLILTICQTPDEKNGVKGGIPGSLFRFWVAKNSKGPGEIEIPMKINYGTVDITYNDQWTEEMKTLYGFRKANKSSYSPPTPSTIASVYGADGKSTMDCLSGKEVGAANIKSHFGSFKSKWESGVQV